MKVKILLCGCNGRRLVPEQIDMNTLPSEVETDLDVKYVAMHPLLCGAGGGAMLGDILRVSDRDTYVVMGGCDPATQQVYFGDVIDETGFPREHVIHVDIRGMDNQQALTALLGAVNRIGEKEHVSLVGSDGLDG